MSIQIFRKSASLMLNLICNARFNKFIFSCSRAGTPPAPVGSIHPAKISDVLNSLSNDRFAKK
jgi:hypothetical protein